MNPTPVPAASTAASLEALLRAGVRLLGGVSASPRLDTECLLAHALACSRTALFTRRTEVVPAETAARFLAMIEERRAGRPVAQITGRREFWSLPLAVTPDVLVPRPETELLVERALAHLPANARGSVLDLGTGSGAVALAIASERPLCTVLATDISKAALEVARHNARALALGQVQFAEGDWYAAVGATRFDLVVSNPPYIAAGEWPATDPELAFEPRAALAAGADGLEALRLIIAGAPAHLSPGGWLVVEHGAGQAEAVRALMAAAGLGPAATSADLAGLPRATEAAHS